MDAIERVREFNRYYTRRLGVLSDRYLGQERPLSEARMLFEIGAGPAPVRELRARLGLDSGFVSRLLRALEGQGLVVTRADPDDGRVRIVSLTAAGEGEVRELTERSRAGVRQWLEPLTEGQRGELVAAQGRIRALLRLASVTVAAVPDDAAEARECLRAYAGELAGRFPEGYDDDALIAPGTLGGTFLVAREGDATPGTGSPAGTVRRPPA